MKCILCKTDDPNNLILRIHHQHGAHITCASANLSIMQELQHKCSICFKAAMTAACSDSRNLQGNRMLASKLRPILLETEYTGRVLKISGLINSTTHNDAWIQEILPLITSMPTKAHHLANKALQKAIELNLTAGIDQLINYFQESAQLMTLHDQAVLYLNAVNSTVNPNPIATLLCLKKHHIDLLAAVPSDQRFESIKRLLKRLKNLQQKRYANPIPLRLTPEESTLKEELSRMIAHF